jgi:hypothetical protein
MDGFWENEGGWPNDTPQCIFLARVVQKIGAAMFGDKWTGREIITKQLPALPAQQAASFWDVRRALRLLGREVAVEERPELKSVWLGHGTRIRHPSPAISMFTIEEWAQAGAEARQQNQLLVLALQRLNAVHRDIVKRCASGELISATRPAKGGATSERPATAWNTELWHHRFVMCQMNPRDPFSYAFAGDQFEWIFLIRKSFDQYLLSYSDTKIDAETLPHLSPYLRTMIAVAKRLEVSPANQPKKVSVEAEIVTTWRGAKAPSPTQIASMATFIREPESQAGRRPHRPTRKKKGPPKS